MILSEGKNNLLSPSAIKPKVLKEIIHNLSATNRILSPLFPEGLSNEYYRMKMTTATWERDKIIVTLKIPLISFV